MKKKTPPTHTIANIELKVSREKDFKDYLTYLSHPGHIMWRNFLAGTFHGLGLILGTALFLTIFAFLTSKVFGEIPFFSDFAKAINVWLEQNVK